MQHAEPEYRFMDDGLTLAIPCPTTSFSSASSNSSSPYEVFTPISRRSTPNNLRLDFDGYQSYGGHGDLTPPSAMHKYMFGPVKAEHGTLPPSTPLMRKMSDGMPYDHILDMNNMTTHSLGSLTPSGSLPVYPGASLPHSPYSISPTHSISPSEMGDNASSWCNNNSPIFSLGQKVHSPQDVESLELGYSHSHSHSPMRQYYLHRLPPTPNRLSAQREAMIREARLKTTELHSQMKVPRRVPDKHDSSYDVVRKAMCKCDYPGCQKAFRRNEHLKRHKQTFHGEGPNRFSCEFCGKDQFNRQDNLNNHRKLHARPNSRNRGVEFIPAAVPVIEQEERSRKRRAPPKSRLTAGGAPAPEKRSDSY
ncbi:uncharacterized protein TRIREDRAFT_108357 [Trichoderma reesei QM6a]|uniref:Predicted protein n=2 Tax=Hypocrea jecorina TaxID=51453 RepID=G0RLK1_HYPJQ|nr:uncharacterized protein TRIREDRAFT_108357 [Trichoderma reesei QM6a]EGR48150.1 predicted protein [Trichoderma reesei QM6a]